MARRSHHTRRLGALAGLGALVAAGALAVAVDVASAAPSADLSASISPPVAANPGSAVTLSFTARNNGPERAQSVTVTVDLTRGASTFVSLTAPAGWSCLKPAAGADVDTVRCSISQLASGQLGQFDLVIRPKTAFTGTISVGVRVASSTGDPNVANDTSTTSVRVVASADIGVTVSGPSTAPVNIVATYTFTVRNNGPGFAGLVRLRIPIPNETEFVSTRTHAWTCLSPNSTGLALCSGSLGVGESRSVELVLKVDLAATGTITTRGETVYENDPNGANNAAALSVPVTQPRADLAVTVNASTSFTAPGAIITTRSGS